MDRHCCANHLCGCQFRSSTQNRKLNTIRVYFIRANTCLLRPPQEAGDLLLNEKFGISFKVSVFIITVRKCMNT